MTERKIDPSAGFTLVEVLVATMFVAVALLAFAHTFTAAYLNVVREGNETMSVSAARQLLEDVKQLPFANLAELQNFDTANSGSLPTNQPARDVARRLRYAVAGDGGGWSYTDNERARWSYLQGDHGSPNAQAQVNVVAQTATLSRITISITMPGQPNPVRLSTLRAAF